MGAGRVGTVPLQIYLIGYNRQAGVDRLLPHLAGYPVVLFDDGSVPPLRAPCVVRSEEPHGKVRYWQWVREVLAHARKNRADRYLFLADDLIPTDGCVASAMRLFDRLGRLAALNVLTDDRSSMWGVGPRCVVDEQTYGRAVIDGAFLCDRAFLESVRFTVSQIPASRWASHPHKGSGVWLDVTQRALRAGARIFQVRQPIFGHGDMPSWMNPVTREKEPLRVGTCVSKPCALIADGSASEFGWELMSWQGYVRAVSRGYDRLVVATTAGREDLYADLHASFCCHSVPIFRDCWKRTAALSVPAYVQYVQQLDRLAEQLGAEGYEVSRLVHNRSVPSSEQQFVRMGNPSALSSPPDLLIHARAKPGGGRYHNWPTEKWEPLVRALLSDGLRIGAIGHPDEALCFDGTEDLRGLPLGRLADVVSAAKLLIGPSSGPMHFASLCGTPHIVWTHQHRQGAVRCTNAQRYAQVWNPFGTWCRVLHPFDIGWEQVRTVVQYRLGTGALPSVPAVGSARTVLRPRVRRVNRTEDKQHALRVRALRPRRQHGYG